MYYIAVYSILVLNNFICYLVDTTKAGRQCEGEGLMGKREALKLWRLGKNILLYMVHNTSSEIRR